MTVQRRSWVAAVALLAFLILGEEGMTVQKTHLVAVTAQLASPIAARGT
jgi:hypothetical protein